MKSRIVISALILTVLCAAKVFFPENAAKVRDAVLPAITREASLGEDCLVIGKVLSGEKSYVDAWERLLGREKTGQTSAPAASPSPSPTRAMVEATGEFALSDMIGGNLRGYEALAGLPTENAAPAESSETHVTEPSAAVDAVVSPQIPVAVSSEISVAPEALPVGSSAPLSEQSAKIEAFLQEQSVFSDYAVPANVSYEAPELPFEHAAPCVGAVTSGFGYRDHPLENVVKFHYGTDLGAYDGDAVKAFADGKVLSVQELDGYGLTVLIEHTGGFETLYAHCSRILVEQGDSVMLGDKIALAGHSGDVTGPHLHFEIIYNGKYLNPEFYLL